MSWFAIEDGAAGRKSRSAFIALGAFWFSAFKFLVSGATLRLGKEFSVAFGSVDAGLMGAFLGVCLSLYCGRRLSDSWERRGIKPCEPTEKGGVVG